ncbi:unnamed protein product, partial [Effrenium voratum]
RLRSIALGNVDKASNIARQIGNGCWRKKVVLCSCFAKERGLQGPPSQRSCLSISGRLVWGWRQLGLQVMAGCCDASALPKNIRREWIEELTLQTSLNASEVKALYARFRRLAPNGFLLPQQFQRTMGTLELSDDAFLPEHMFRVFDSNEDGMLSFHEFATALATMIRGTEDEKLRLSFNMAAGKCQAEHLSLQDLLVRACKGLTSSLVALSNDTSEKDDVERLFFELVGTSDVMTFETYKAAAQHEGFLMSLGLARGRAVRTRVATGVAEREAAMASNRFAWAQTVSPVSSQSRQDAFVALADITEMHSRLNRVDDLLHKKAAQTADFSEDTHVVNFADASPLRRPASPQANLVSLGVADAWQDLARFVEEWDALRGKIGGLQGSSGLLGVREASLPLDDEEMESKVTSRAMSRMSSKHSAETGITGEYVWRRQQTMQASHRKQRRRRLLAPKKGLAVHFGHESWNMVLSMMVGIRMSVARCKHEIHRELQPVDYIMQEKFTITPRLMPYRDERKTTRFVDFAPMVFQEIRSRFGISEEEYLRSVGPEQLLGNLVLGNLSSLSELSSEGKSGAFFYYTADGKYMMKTVTPKEFVLLRKMLKGYSDHIKENPGTLVVRFLGLHCLRAQRKSRRPKKNLYFVVMANMFNTPCEIHRRYDLKGSWVGRVTLPENRNSHIALKDVDFQQANEKIIVGKERKSLLAQIRRDSEFLASNNIIDYSLLLGIHDKDSALAVQAKGEVLGFVSEDSRTIYFMGIIDILTPFDKMKKLEHTLKALRHDWHGVSCCPPSFYASRFCNFMERAFG